MDASSRSLDRARCPDDLFHVGRAEGRAATRRTQHSGSRRQRGHRGPADVDFWLSSGWWVEFRNQFAQAPVGAAKVIDSIGGELSKITAELEGARGDEMVDAKDRLWEMTFGAQAPDYWR